MPGRQIEHAHRVNNDSATAVLVCDAGSDSSRAFLAVEFSTVEFAGKAFYRLKGTGSRASKSRGSSRSGLKLRIRIAEDVLKAAPSGPCLTSGPTFVTLRPWKRPLSASDSGPPPQRAKSDFLSVGHSVWRAHLVCVTTTSRSPSSGFPTITRRITHRPVCESTVDVQFRTGLSPV